MKKSTAIVRVALFGAALLATYILVPMGFRMGWDTTLRPLFGFLLIFGSIIFFLFTASQLEEVILAAGRPINASALEPEVLYIVESVTVQRGAGTYVASLAVLKRAVLNSGEIDKQTDRLLVFFPRKELREGGRVMAVTTKWFDAFSKSGATSETALVIIESEA